MLAPTLIVGLGGTGSDIVKRVAKQVNEEQEQHIRFVVFDTDVNELSEIRAENNLIRTVQTSTKMTVGEYLEQDVHAKDQWFPVSPILNKKTLTEGAGQVRAISRLALDTAMKKGNIEPLHKAIEELNQLTGEQAQQALRVIVVSSLAGGTGSGLILPVAMYIKHFLATRFKQSANIMRGFFILPEVFYEVITGQPERNNLRCNAYATLRELDAFLMKGDGTLPEKYKDLKFEVPRIGSDEYDSYEETPYDFCFLFDAQNKDGKKLTSFEQYKEHAANCIYAQSIGPMNKRSNSSEDNVVRLLCKTGGRSRYCGAGSAMLVYPFKDIKEYLALQWAKESVSTQWLVFDQEYRKMLEENKKKRSQGYQAMNITPDKYYVTSIDSAAENKNAFAMAIKNACSNLTEDGLISEDDKWEIYIAALRQHVDNMLDTVQVDVEEQRRECEEAIGAIGVDGEYDFTNAYMKLVRYKGLSVKRTSETARTIAYSLFKSDNGNVTKDKNKHQLETYLRDAETGSFIHPNAARYFLYQTMDALKKQKLSNDSELKEKEEYILTFEKTKFDNPDTKDVTETYNDISDKIEKKPILGKLRKLTAKQEDVLKKFNTFFQSISEYRFAAVYAMVLEEAISYVQNICESFQLFYTVFEGRVEQIDSSIKTLEKKYHNLSGHAVRYVCASPKCLHKLLAKAPYSSDGLDLPGELCDEIYSKIREYAMMGDDKPKNDSYFLDLFDTAILEHFRNALMRAHGSEIDIDIISALEVEAGYEKEIFNKDEVERYVEDAINSTKILAAPFIEEPIGEQRQPVRACAYNPCLYIKGDINREALVNRTLANNGGVKDNDIEKNMILFYEALYGLRANELSKFAPPSKSETARREGGEYYTAYFDLINQIRPGKGAGEIITPHLDREWHLISKMPDLDEGNQKMIERNIYKAMVFGLIFGKIVYRPIVENERYYRIAIGEETQDFVVSNHTPCDNYFEILDSLTINPIVVKTILSSVEEDIKYEKLKKIDFSRTLLKTRLEKFKLVEFSGNIQSVFDLAMLLKISTPSEDFFEEDGKEFVRAILDMIYEYMEQFCPKQKLNYDYAEFIISQYRRFVENYSWYEEHCMENIDSFKADALNITISRLRKLGRLEEAMIISDDLERASEEFIEKTRRPDKF